ncbi:hypothetical protein EZ428_23925 [Pedobacter frigiditerrae]|uniref:Transposase n=2 Tax=Pedobacter frigiditerrae TaxID=2530452 RepID=A0A4R0MIF8_9SPHI|nr:hypothetical protein [Pedobacter frigiditerrae]TCC86330.1 hypothetical protein EZ428_23925 [Pedobacter frigiditerrae]
MKKEKYVFSESLKRSILDQVLSGSITKEEARRRYGIKSKSGVLYWLRNYEKYGTCSLNLLNHPMPLNPEEPTPPEPSAEELKFRIKELERQLSDEQLRSNAYSLMIDIAERELKVPIRKKSNTK